MKHDLLFTETGDITFSAIDFNSRTSIFDYNFYISPSECLLFNFMVDNNSPHVSDDKTKIRADIYIKSIEDLDAIENPVEGTKIYISETNTIYKITTINKVAYLDDTIIEKIGDIQPVEFSPNFDFEFYLYKPKQDKQAVMVNDKKYIQQAIRIRLESESGTIRGNEDAGADLFRFMHSDMQASKLLTKIAARVKDAISDILPNCTVQAYSINSDYFNYHNTIKIVIINNEEVYYYYV